MCSHCASASGPILVCCGGATNPSPPVSQPPAGGDGGSRPPGGGGPPSPAVPCERVRVRIDSIHVTKSESYGFFGEPGASAEWNMTITVNDQSRTWTNDDVRDGRDYNIGWDFVVDLPNSSATVSVRSSGFEDDLTSANDPLPSAEQTHGSADNWGVGATRQLAASSADFDYSISYTVSCLQQLDVSVISRQEVLRTVQARLSARGSRSERSESDLLSVFISKMMARGMRFRGIDSDLLTWEGPASIHRVAAEAFPTTAPGDGKS